MATRRVQTKSVGLPALYCPGHLTPTTDNVYDLGTATKRFRNIYLTGSLAVGAFTAASLTVGTLTGVLKGVAGVVSASTIIDSDVSASAAIAFSKLEALTSGQILVGSAGNVATAVTPSGDVTISAAGVTTIGAGKVSNAMLAGSIAYSKLSLTGAILNADLAGSIAYSKLSLTGAILNADLAGSIAFAKLATLSSGNLLIGSAGNVATSVAVTGDVTISDLGVTTIGASKVTNAMLAGSIAYSKLSLTGAILNADLAGSIAYSKLSLTGAILNADLAGSIAYNKLSLTGAILNADLAGSIAYSKLSLTGAILNADLAGSIAYSKLVLTTSIVNGDIAVAAAIAGSKITPAFGAQALSTSGTAALGDTTVTGTLSSSGNFSVNTDAFAVTAATKVVTIGASGSTASHLIQGSTLTTRGGANLLVNFFASDTGAASSTTKAIFRGNDTSGANLEQIQLDFFYGNGSSSRQLGRINFQNTSATVGSAGGQFRIQTVTTGGTLLTAMIITEAQAVQLNGVLTTASAANCFLDNANNNNVLRSTSSIRYKENVIDLGLDTSKIFSLRAVEFDDKTLKTHHFGLIAEEVADIMPELVQYTRRCMIDPTVFAGTPEGEALVPDGVQYSLLSVLLLKELAKLKEVVKSLKK